MKDAASHSLAELVAEHGAEIADDPRRLEAFLRDYCPECRREIFALVAAAREGIPSRLVAQGHELGIDLIAGGLAQSLEDDYGLSAQLARWTVESWAGALGIETPAETAPPTKGAAHPTMGPAPATVVPPPLEATRIQPPSAVLAPLTVDNSSQVIGPVAPVGAPGSSASRLRRLALVLVTVAVFVCALGAGAMYARARSGPQESGALSTTTTGAPVSVVGEESSSSSTAPATTSSTVLAVEPSTTTLSTVPPSSTTTTTTKTTAAASSTTTSVMTAAGRVQCTKYGATVEVPAGWSVTDVEAIPKDGVTQFEAREASGNLIRVNANLANEAKTATQEVLMNIPDDRVRVGGQQWVDWGYAFGAIVPFAFAGNDAVQWTYSFQTRDRGVPSDYTTIYLDPSEGPVTGIVATVMSDASPAQKQETADIQSSFYPSGE